METQELEKLIQRIWKNKDIQTKAREALQSSEAKHFLVRYGKKQCTQSPLTRINHYALQRLKEKTKGEKNEQYYRDLSSIYQESLTQAANTCSYAREEEGIILFRWRENYLPPELGRRFARITQKHSIILKEIGKIEDYMFINLLQIYGKNPLLISANTITEDRSSAHLFILEQKRKSLSAYEVSFRAKLNALRLLQAGEKPLQELEIFYQQWTGSLDLLEGRITIREHEMKKREAI